jgi:serine/threonine-protein kinase
LNDNPRPIEELRPDVPPRLAAVVMKCLEKDRNARFTTVGDLATALVEFAHPSSQVHIERARRVLGSADVTLSGLGSSRKLLAPGLAPNIETPTEIPVSEPTVNSWGRTGGNVAVPTGRKRGLVWALVVFSTVSVGVAGALFFRLSSAHNAADPPTGGSAAAAQPSPLTTLPSVTTAEVAPPATVATVTPAESPPTPATPPSAPIVKNVPLNRPVVTAKPAPQVKPASPPVSSAPETPANTISEFGGRR